MPHLVSASQKTPLLSSIHKVKRLLNARENQFADETYLMPFLLLLALYCGWVLSLPLFPTQDDSMHLYYVNVLHQLASGHSLFSHFYSVRHPIPPYTIQYLLLFGLTSLMDPVVAEKCMVCVILGSTAFGFRYLAMAIGRNGRLMSLWIFPVALSWPLFMGFHNFCLSLSFVLWALAFWYRAAETRSYAYHAAFLLTVFVVAFTHPVPLVFLLGVVAVDVCTRIAAARFIARYNWRVAVSRERLRLAIVAVSYSSLGYISLFLNRPVKGKVSPTGYVFPDFLDLVHLQHMSFASGGAFTKLHRAGLYLILLLALTLASRNLRKVWETGRVTGAGVMCICALALLVLMPILPSKMNGLEYFAERLPLIVWLFALAAASGSRTSRRVRRVASATAIAFSIFTVGLANHFVRPVAKEISTIELPHGRLKAGLLFDAPIKIQHANLSFNPYFRWGGVRYFERAGALLLDDPWAGPPNILPIDRVPNRDTAQFSQHDLQYPEYLYKHLVESNQERNAVLSKIDFIVFVGKPARGAVDNLLAIDTARHWDCNQSTWYFVCTATPTTAGASPVSLQRTTPTTIEDPEKVLFVRNRYPKRKDLSGESPYTYTRQN